MTTMGVAELRERAAELEQILRCRPRPQAAADNCAWWGDPAASASHGCSMKPPFVGRSGTGHESYDGRAVAN